ncbi:MAG: deoxyribodipyrimidine photo-lyase [Crenarchaeota archaeon]|nr:deoxyribodipyrimidine photo-lyase [Thermoproteota archaeon]
MSADHGFKLGSIQRERIKKLNEASLKNGSYILYWMQASPRTEYNHALEYAVEKANELNRPLIAFFGITGNFPEANERSYWFMLEGLLETKKSLEERGIQLVVWNQSPEKGILKLSRQASLLVSDRGYLRIQRRWYQYVAGKASCPFIQVETNVVVPVETASSKEEYSAATLRPKLTRILGKYLIPLKERSLRIHSLDMEFESVELENPRRLLDELNVDRTVKKVESFKGGTSEAKKHLRVFIRSKLDEYPTLRNNPTVDFVSNMSPYLHFGQISPVYIALEVLKTESPGKETYLEELIVRRELSMNFLFYNEEYDSFDCLPEWAKNTLMAHRKDPRPYKYSLEELENSETHDSVWNAAQQEMVETGKMHGYMRMYWAKKILEWVESPVEAFRIALYLNNKYELDGRDPNSFAGVAWCFGKHDRPWRERPIYGKVRYMSENGLKRKFDVDKYIKKLQFY